MKKFNIFTLLIVFAFVFMLSCSSSITSNETSENNLNNFPDASMVVIEDTITKTGVTVEFEYTGSNQGQYGAWYSIEVYQDDQWQELPYIIDNVAFNAMAYLVETGVKKQQVIVWEWLYGELASGRYRVTINFIDHVGPGDYSEFLLSSEFEIE